MKMIAVVALALVAVVAAAPIDNKVVEIVSQDNKSQPDGGYGFSFKSADGIERQENGELKEVVDESDKPQKVVVVRGFYTYFRNDGKPETVQYYADETGYHAEGESIPKPDPST